MLIIYSRHHSSASVTAVIPMIYTVKEQKYGLSQSENTLITLTSSPIGWAHTQNDPCLLSGICAISIIQDKKVNTAFLADTGNDFTDLWYFSMKKKYEMLIHIYVKFSPCTRKILR